MILWLNDRSPYITRALDRGNLANVTARGMADCSCGAGGVGSFLSLFRRAAIFFPLSRVRYAARLRAGFVADAPQGQASAGSVEGFGSRL